MVFPRMFEIMNSAESSFFPFFVATT